MSKEKDRRGKELELVDAELQSEERDHGLAPLIFESQTVRVVTGADGEPWFTLNDVCQVLEIGNPRDVAARLEDGQKGVGSIDTPGGLQPMTVIDETGLIDVIMSSRKPEARAFRRVALEYIKSVGRNGVALSGLSSDEVAVLTNDPQGRRLMEMVRFRAVQLAQEERLAELERQVASLGELTDGYVSIMGWANINHVRVDVPLASIIGKRAVQICQREGVRVGRVRDPRFGQVNTYPESIIDRAFVFITRALEGDRYDSNSREGRA